MAKQFWEDDATVASSSASSDGNFWEGDSDAAKQDLPKDVKPSTEQGGRGSINPLNIAEMRSEANKDKPSTVMAAAFRRVDRPAAPDKRPLLERSVEGATEGERALLTRQERRANWEQDQVNMRAPSATGSTRPKDDAALNRGADFGLAMEGDGPISRVAGPVGRVAGKVVSGVAQGLGGVAEAAGDLTGIDTLARAGKATAEGAEAFQKGMGKGNDTAGFGPKSPVPYLAEQAEGAASSLGQSAALAGAFGSRAVIAAQAILQGGQSYNEARQAGMDPATALARAVPQGAFEAIGEKFQGLDKLTGAMGTLLQRGASDAAKRTAADALVKAGIREIPGEVLTYLGQTGTDLIPGIGLNQNMTMDQFLKGLADTVVQSAIMGGATAGGGHAAGGQINRAPQMSAAELARSKGFLRPEATPAPGAPADAAVAPDSPVPAAVSPVAPAAPAPATPAEVTNPAAAAPVSPVLPAEAQPVPAAVAPVELAPAPAPRPGALTRAAMNAGAITPDGTPTAMNDPHARPKTFAEQQEAMNAVAQLEAEHDAQSDFEAAMLADEALPPAPPEGAQDAQSKSPAPAPAAPAQPAATVAAEEKTPAPAPAPALAPALEPNASSDGENSGRSTPAQTDRAPAAPAKGAVDATPAPGAQDRAEPAAGQEEGAYRSVAAAAMYIRQQRSRGATVAAAPFTRPDGTVTIATKGTPEYEQALDQRQARLKGEKNGSLTGNAQPVVGRSDRSGRDNAAGSVAPALGRADATGATRAARPAKPSVPAQPAPLGREPGTDALKASEAVDPSTGKQATSWVVREKETGKVVMETFDRAKVDALNTKRYEAVPVGQHLQEVNDPKALAHQVARATPTDAAAHEAATSPTNSLPEPTQAQKEAGNYRMGHLSGEQTQGIDITVENPKDSTRSGTSPDGTKWSNTMGAHYGYAKRSEAADGDHVDVFVGPAADRAPTVWVIDQVNADGTYDEAKAMFGFMNKAAALKAYKGSYAKGWKVGPVTAMPVAEFKAGLESGRFKKPVATEEIAKLRNSAISAQSSTATPAAGSATQNATPATEKAQSETGKPQSATKRGANATPKPKRELKADRLKREAEEARAKYFTPGNVVRGYGGFDRVISYQPPAGDGFRWSVTVQEVAQDKDGRWVDSERSLERTHSTPPTESNLRVGPRDRIKTTILNSESQLSAQRRAAMAEKEKGDGVKFSVAEATETPAFKKWFGDSKVVDSKGAPLVVYHGTPSAGLRVFDAKKIGANGRAEGAGFYFTTDKAVADAYGQRGETLQVYLNISKPLAYDAKPFSQIQMQKVLTEVAKAEATDAGMEWRDGFLSNYVDTYGQSLPAAVREAARAFANDETALDQVSGIVSAGVDATTVNDGLKNALGYDGYFSKGFSGEGQGGGDIWVAMRSEQIKSATDNSGAFDATNPDIKMRTGEGAGPAVQTKPASTEHDRKAARLLNSLRDSQESYISFQAVEPNDTTDAGKMLAAVRLTAKRLFGHDVVFVRFNGPAVFNGAMSESMPDTVFVRVDSSKPHMAILGHELLHSLRAQSPGLYAAIEQRLNQLTNDQTTGYYRELKKKYDAIGREAPEGSKLREELYADIVGDHFLDPQFWDGMAADQRGLFRRVADAVVRFLDKVIAKLGVSNAFGTQAMLKDAQEARRVVIAGMRAFSEEARSRSGLAPLGASSLSATSRKPAAATEFTRRSKVKHVVYHATNADFNTFDTTKSDLGAHFGTVEQANKVAASRLFGREGTTNIMPVYLDLRSPLRLKDVGTFHADGIAPQLAAKGWMSKAEAKAMVAAIDRDWKLRPKYDQQVRELIQSEGYDGVVYKNTHEGEGDSYIVFNPSQVKSATGNVGTFDRNSDDIRMSAADIPRKANPALTRAIFGGSMEYMRDQNGKPVKAAEQIEKYKAIDTDERGQMLLRQGHVTADQLKRWKESPLDVYDGAVNNRFRKHFESPGIVWSDAELRNIFKLDDEGVAAYRALRAQADESIARNAVASMLRLAGKDGLAVRDQVLSEPMDVAAMTLRDHLLTLADQRRTPAPAPKVQMTEKERADAMAQAVRLEGEAEALSQKSPDNPPAAALAKIDEAKVLRANVAASIQAPAKMTAEAKVLVDRANAVVDLLDQANDDMGNGHVPDDMKAQARPNPWESTEPTRADRFIYELQDGKIDLKRTQEAILKAGGEIAEKFDARLSETLYAGRMAKRTQSFLEVEAKPLLQEMAKQGIGQVELGDYLHARAAPERNAQIAKINADMPDGGAGSNSKGLLLTNAAARQYIADIPAEKRAKLEALAQRVDGITRGTRALLVTEGLEKADTIAAWEAVYKTYVPMFREDVEFSRIVNSKRATGSEKKAVNILANVLLQREAAITRAEKNRVKVALYGLALSNPNPKFWVTIRPEGDRAQMLEDVKSMGIDPVEAEAGMASPPTITTVDPVDNIVKETLNPFLRDLPTAITLKVNGENRVLLLNEDDPRALRMANAMKGADNLTQFDIAGSIIGKTTRWLAAVNTQYNPVFGIVNFMRDTMGGVIHLGNTELRGSGTQVVAGLPGAMKGIAAHLAGGHDSGKWSKLFDQFQRDGGQTGFREMFADGTRRAEAVEKDLKRMGQSRVDPRRMARNMMGLLSGFNEVTENAVRLSAYAVALDKGISRAEAARLARELTVDFNRKGRATREIGPLYAFFNAAVQGNERTLRALRGPTGKYIIAGGLALGVAQALMLAAAGIDDDEIPDYAKARALVIPLFNKEKSYILIPLPLGLHVIPNTGRVITEMVLGDHKDMGKKAFDAIGEITGAFNPLGGGNVFTMDGALRTLAPTLIDPLIELGFNKNFAGNQIERDPRGETDIRPGFQRARESTQKRTTGQAYLGISKAMNWATGGSDFEAGKISPTPERIRYVAQVALGGVLRETEKIIDTSTAAARGEGTKPANIPVASRFYGQVDDERTQQSRYFQNKKAIEKLRNAEKAAHKAGNVEGLQRLQANPLHSVLKPAAKIDRSIQELNKLAVQVIGDVEQQKAVDAKRVEAMRTLNEGVKGIEQATNGPTLADRLKVTQ